MGGETGVHGTMPELAKIVSGDKLLLANFTNLIFGHIVRTSLKRSKCNSKVMILKKTLI